LPRADWHEDRFGNGILSLTVRFTVFFVS
jgi:hypothetical protein